MTKTSNIIPTAILLIVSASAFAAGYLQNDFLERADQLQQDAVYHQMVSNNIKNTFVRINDDEFREIDKANDYKTQAESLVIAYLNLAPTLSVEERQTYIDQIAYLYLQMEWALENTWSFLIYDNFELSELNEDIYLDSFLDLNYFVIVNRSIYDAYDYPVTLQFADEYLTENLIDYGIVPQEEAALIDEIANNYFMPSVVISVNVDPITDILIDYALTHRSLGDDLAAQSTEMTQLVSQLSIGVSITTVASVLAVAMYGRIENNQLERQFSRVRADILKDEDVLVSERDPLAILALLVALFIALIGLLIPVYLAFQAGVLF